MARVLSAKNRRIRQVLVCLRRGKPGAVGVAMVLKSIFQQAGVKARWVSESGLARAKRGRIDAVVVGGGDGTMLHAAQATMGWGIPLLGINLGSLGFLTSVKAGEVGTVLPEILRGRFGVSTRTVLSVKLLGGRQEWSALNEVSVGPQSGQLMVRVRVKVGGGDVVGVSCGWASGGESNGFDCVFLIGGGAAGESKGKSDGFNSGVCACDGAASRGGGGAGGCRVVLEPRGAKCGGKIGWKENW